MKKGRYRVGKKTWGEGEGRKQDRPKRAYLVVPIVARRYPWKDNTPDTVDRIFLSLTSVLILHCFTFSLSSHFFVQKINHTEQTRTQREKQARTPSFVFATSPVRKDCTQKESEALRRNSL